MLRGISLEVYGDDSRMSKSVATYLSRCHHADLWISDTMRQECAENLWFRHHIGIQNADPVIGKAECWNESSKSGIDVSCLVTMAICGLVSRSVMQVGKLRGQLVDLVAEKMHVAIISKDHPKSGRGIVDPASCNDGVQDDVDGFTTCDHDDDNTRHIITDQTQDWSLLWVTVGCHTETPERFSDA